MEDEVYRLGCSTLDAIIIALDLSMFHLLWKLLSVHQLRYKRFLIVGRFLVMSDNHFVEKSGQKLQSLTSI